MGVLDTVRRFVNVRIVICMLYHDNIFENGTLNGANKVDTQDLSKRWPTGWPAEKIGGGQKKRSVLEVLRHQESLLLCFPFLL